MSAKWRKLSLGCEGKSVAPPPPPMKEHPAQQLMGVIPTATVDPLNRSEQRARREKEVRPEKRARWRCARAVECLRGRPSAPGGGLLCRPHRR